MTSTLSSFAQLASVKAEIAAKAQAKAQAALLAAQKAEAARKAAHLFAETVGTVSPLPSVQRHTPAPKYPPPIAQQRALDNEQVMRDSLSDHFGVEQLLETDVDLSYRAAGIGTDILHKLRRGDWAVQAQLDLHGLRVDEARPALNAFLKHATEQGLRCVRIIHGKGLGSSGKRPILKSKARSWLAQKQEVLAYVAARPAEGGHGALMVLLKGA